VIVVLAPTQQFYGEHKVIYSVYSETTQMSSKYIYDNQYRCN